MIVSRMNGLALNVDKSNMSPGAYVRTWHKDGTDSEQWYKDGTGAIKSKLNGFCLDIGGKLYTLFRK